MDSFNKHLLRQEYQKLAELGVEVIPENKKDFDRKIHEYLGVEYKNCSQTWKLIKERRAADPEAFMTGLKTALQ